MALKAGYVGIKSQLMQSLRDKLLKLDGIIPADASSSNKLATASDINDIWSANAVLGAKNRLHLTLAGLKALNTSGTWNDNVYTNKGCTFTVNSDMTITVSGQATGGNANLNLSLTSETWSNIKIVGCPSGGGDNTYGLNIHQTSPSAYLHDYGTGLTLNGDVTFDALWIGVHDTYSITGSITFKPMFINPADTDTTYQPYVMTNSELTGSVIDLSGSADDQKTAINAIITAATGAADFAAFKTAMEAITPVTRFAAPEATKKTTRSKKTKEE